MPRELDVRLEGLGYTVRFAQPAFKLWGAGGMIVRRLYEALSPYGATLADIQIVAGNTNAAQPVLNASLYQNSSVKFGFEHIEFAMNSPTQEIFDSIPGLFRDSTSWIKQEVPDLKFALHSFGYHCHAFIKDSTAKDVLDRVHPRSLKSAGSSSGDGAILHSSVPEYNWTTDFSFDHSKPVPGALYIGLLIETRTETLDYQETMAEGRAYFASVLAELELKLPDGR